jgi:GNAT superfamily N-acetyltransferase
MPAPRVRVAGGPDLAALAPVLARAFSGDPLTRWLVPPGGERSLERRRRLFAWQLERALPLGLSHATEDLRAAALWLPWEARLLPLPRRLRLLPEALRVVGSRRAPTRIVGIGAVRRRRPRIPHRYLAVLGVDPPLQGRGVGSALLRAGVGSCDAAGVPAYLETSGRRNLPLYERHGFRITGEVRVPFGGPTVWLLWRAPAASPSSPPS